MMKKAVEVAFNAKAVKRDDGLYDPCVEATVTYDDGSTHTEWNLVGGPRAKAEHAIEDAVRYVREQ